MMDGRKDHLTFIFSSDLHGNLEQYIDLCDAAIRERVDVLLIGGDLFPKRQLKFPKGQEEYFNKQIFPILQSCKQKNENILIYVIFGNADCSFNLTAFKKLGETSGVFTFLCDEFVQIKNSDYFLFGYSHVTLSPHRKKDWESFDWKDPAANGQHDERSLKGYSTSKAEPEDVSLDPQTAPTRSIEADLGRLVSAPHCSIPPRRQLWMVHGPPHDTNLDLIKVGEHVGSKSLRRYIEQVQPLMTFHGHIHETVYMSGSHCNLIGSTGSYSSGNRWNLNVSYVLANTAHPHHATWHWARHPKK